MRIAHDIKTPLSLIMLPLSKMKKEVVLNEKLDKELDIAIKIRNVWRNWLINYYNLKRLLPGKLNCKLVNTGLKLL